MKKGGNRKPNRGGGKFNKPKAYPPGKFKERKEEAKEKRFDDEFVQVCTDSTNFGQGDRQSERDGKPRYGLRPPKNQARIQRLQMSNENQEMVTKILQQLQIEGLREKQNEPEDFSQGKSYNPHEAVKNERYWKRMEDQRLVVEEAIATTKDEEIANKFAMSKLLKCGFEENRCILALQNCSDDVGAALEQLIAQSCGVNQLSKENQHSEEDQLNEAKAQRSEEAIALESIYGKNFTETISDRIWIIKLTLEYITEFFKQQKRRIETDLLVVKPRNTPRNVCKYFLKGQCKFGNKCRMSHQLQCRSEFSNQENLGDGSSSNESIFHLEIRFPVGSLYPHEVPIIAFYSVLDIIPRHTSLNIMLRLTDEAKSLAQDGVPAVFTLVSFLEDKEQMIKLLSLPPSEFSLREVKREVFNKQKEGNVGVTESREEGSQNVCERVRDPFKHKEKETLNRKLKQQFQKLQVLYLVLMKL